MTENRRAVHPGEIILEEMMRGFKVSADELAQALDIPRYRVHALVTGASKVTPELAVKLGYVLDTTPEFWLNLQHSHDLATMHSLNVDTTSLTKLSHKLDKQ